MARQSSVPRPPRAEVAQVGSSLCVVCFCLGSPGPPACICALRGSIHVDIADYSLAASCDDLTSVVLLGFELPDLPPRRAAVGHPSDLCTGTALAGSGVAASSEVCCCCD